MLSRHEEKYIIDYEQYAVLKSRAAQLLTQDSHGAGGSYSIASLYFDDRLDHALYEKLDGLPEHTKFRIRTYDCSNRTIKLERKDKRGILTEKFAAAITPEQLAGFARGDWNVPGLSPKGQDLADQMKAAGLIPTVIVRYQRDAFYFPGTDLRLTFDSCLEALSPDWNNLFSPHAPGVPALGKHEVIMEIKYGAFLPAFVRKLTKVDCKQLSVSKYALCRENTTR